MFFGVDCLFVCLFVQFSMLQPVLGASTRSVSIQTLLDAFWCGLCSCLFSFQCDGWFWVLTQVLNPFTPCFVLFGVDCLFVCLLACSNFDATTGSGFCSYRV